MASTIEDLLKRALQLPVEERVQLANELVESLDAEALTQLDRKWIAEAKHRRDEVRNGYVQAIPGSEGLLIVKGILTQ
jgi:putative addiction module component (TIGR02574 family)